jgi:hypothetical protein
MACHRFPVDLKTAALLNQKTHGFQLAAFHRLTGWRMAQAASIDVYAVCVQQHLHRIDASVSTRESKRRLARRTASDVDSQHSQQTL